MDKQWKGKRVWEQAWETNPLGSAYPCRKDNSFHRDKEEFNLDSYFMGDVKYLITNAIRDICGLRQAKVDLYLKIVYVCVREKHTDRVRERQTEETSETRYLYS